MPSTKIKIAISGAVSTGKTTMGQALADSLELPFIEENLEKIFVLPQGVKKSPKLRADRVLQTLAMKKNLELAQPGFVVDRSPLDLLNFWFGLLLHQTLDSTEFVERCAEYMKAYDYVVLLPVGVLPVQQKQNSPLSQRNMDPWAQLLGSCRIHGFARHFVAPEKIIDVPKHMIDEQQRLQYVLARLS